MKNENIKQENIFLKLHKIFSYNCMLNILIGERGVGKTFNMLVYLINHYKKKKKKFIWVRRYYSDLDTAIGKNECVLTKKVQAEKFKNDEFSVTSIEKLKYIYMNGEIIGYGVALSSTEDLKGVDFSDVDTIVMDEFLILNSRKRYLTNEPMLLLSLMESVGRLRNDVKTFLLGNSTSIVNPYFDFFNLSLPYNKEIKTFKENTIAVWYIKNEPYREEKRKSKYGKLIKNTPYEKYAIDNEFMNDNNNFIRKKSANSKLFCNLILKGHQYGVWINNHEMYISTKFNSSYKVTITLDYASHNNKTMLLKYNSPFVKNIVNHYKIGNLFFENQTIKHNLIDIFLKASFIY